MICTILVAAKTNSIPIQECGGVVLADGDKILVKSEIADRMLLQYRGYLVRSGTEEKESLRGGHYEYVYKGNKPQDHLAPQEPEQEPEFAGAPRMFIPSSSDRSLFGKAVRKLKGL